MVIKCINIVFQNILFDEKNISKVMSRATVLPKEILLLTDD